MQQQNYYYTPQVPRYTAQPQQPITVPMLRGRPVSSLEEVRAAAVDFDGIVTYFPDLPKGRIYTKQCNMDGTSSINLYELKPIPTETASPENFVTREEFNQAIAAIKEAFNSTTKIDSQQSQTSQIQNQNINTQAQKPLQEFNFN